MSVRVLDRSTGEVRFVDEADAQQGLVEGRYAVSASGGPVSLRDRDGNALEVNPGELGTVLGEDARRFRLEQEQERAARERAAQYEDRALEAGLAGAARGATLGISDQLARAWGADETFQGLREYNEGATVTGEVLGSLLPLAAGGAGAAARGGSVLTRGAGGLLRGLSAPARIAMGAGEAAEAGVGALLGRGVLGSAARTAAGGAAEGALFGAGQVVTEDALGNEDLTAEQVIAGVGMGAILGGVGGGLFGGAGALLREGAGAGAGLARQGRDVIARAWTQRTGRELSPGVADLYARATSLASGADQSAVRRFIDLGPEGRAARDIVRRGDEVYEDGTRRLAEQLSAIEPTTRHVSDYWGTGLKRGQVARQIDASQVDAQGRAAIEALSAARSVADDITANPGLFSGPGGAAQGRNLGRAVEARQAQIESALARAADDPTHAATELYQALDGLKRDIGRFQQRASRDPEATRMLRELYEERFRPMLERGDLWGDGLAATQTDVNRSFTRWLTRRRDFERAFLAEGERDTVDAFRRLNEADPARIAGFLRRVGTAGNERMERTFREVLEAQQDLVETMGRHLELPDDLVAGIGANRAATRRAMQTFEEVSESASTLNQFRELQGAGGIEGSVIGTVAGAALGGPVGAVAAGALASPAQTIRVLSALDRFRVQTDQQITRSVDSYVRRLFRGATEGAERVGREASRRARRAVPPVTIAAFDGKVREYMELADPETATRRLGERTEALSSDAPRTQAAMQRTAMRAADYVRAQIPFRSQRAHLVPGRTGQTRPSQQEMASFLRTVRAVEDPLVLLSELEAGRLSRESVDAVRAVYPQIYARLVEQVQASLAEQAQEGRQVPYRDRLQLGLLLGAPTDPSLRPESIARVQSMYAAQAAASAQPPRSAASKQAPDMASGLMTDTQRLEQRA